MTQRKSQVNLLTIDKFAKICSTTPRTLRFYEKKGLIKPYRINSWNHYRYYHPDQMLNFSEIKLLQKLNLPLTQIHRVRNQNTFNFLEEELKTMKSSLNESQKKYLFLNNTVNFLYKENVKLETKLIGPLNLFCFYIKNGNYTDIGDYLNCLWKEAIKIKLICEKKEILFYHDPYFKPKNTKLEIALSCRKILDFSEKVLPKNFYFRKLPKTKVNVITYKGPYDYLSLIYQKLDHYYLTNKIKVKQPVFEIYKNGPYNTKSEYDYITKIYYPI